MTSPAWTTEDLLTEGQVALLPAGHRLAGHQRLALGEVSDLADLPMARWPRVDSTYPDGPGPEVRTQSRIAQLVSLGKALPVIPASSRAWQWPDHVAVPVTDAPLITTMLAWSASSTSPVVATLVRTAREVADAGLAGTSQDEAGGNTAA